MRRIFVVDDDPLMVRATVKRLRRANIGSAVVEGLPITDTNLEEVVSRILETAEKAATFVVTDYSMVVITGVQLIHRIRESTSNIHFVVWSSDPKQIDAPPVGVMVLDKVKGVDELRKMVEDFCAVDERP